jgi:hypothetical protein
MARKIAAPTKPIAAIIVSNIANVPYATTRQKTATTLHSQKDFWAPTHNPDRPRILRNRRASTCDPAPRIWDFAPRRIPLRHAGTSWHFSRNCRHACRDRGLRVIAPSVPRTVGAPMAARLADETRFEIGQSVRPAVATDRQRGEPRTNRGVGDENSPQALCINPSTARL